MEKIIGSIKYQVLSIKSWIQTNPKEFWILLAIILVGAFLRLYRISDYMTFLGDEGRDVIIVRRLLVYGDPILVGPGTSIGNMYLGPLYYYLMAPALWLSNYSPVGPAVQIAILGIITIFLVWIIAREWFPSTHSVRSEQVAWGALIAAGLYAVSPTVIIYSRSSWNPNIMPFFSLLTVYGVWKMWSKEKFGWLIVIAISFAFVLQSHYLGLLLAPLIGLYWLLTYIKIRNSKFEIRNFLQKSLFSLLIFAGLMSPLVIFDARHGWRNLKSMGDFFGKRQETVSARPWNALPKLPLIVSEVSERLVSAKIPKTGTWIGLAMATSAFIFLIKKYRFKKQERPAYVITLIWLGLASLGFGLYKQQIYDHYYGFIFAAPFFLIGGIFQSLNGVLPRAGKWILYFSLLALIFVNLAKTPILEPPNRQLPRTIEVAKKIELEAQGDEFNLATIAERNYEDAYKYFLLIYGAPVVDIDAQLPEETITKQLFVVCELPREKCQPTSNPKAGIANFGWSKIEKEWEVGGTILYKLGHAR